MPKLSLKKILLFTVVFVIICVGLIDIVKHVKKNVKFWNREGWTSGGQKSSCNTFKEDKRTGMSVSQANSINTTIDFKAEMAKLNKRKVAADDRRLIELIRDYYLVAPSKKPYSLEIPDTLDNSRGQAPIIDNKLKYKENGFYVESGAYDGETLSNTLMFERIRNWDGVLVEPNPDAFKKLMKKNRKAYAINACLSTEFYPTKKVLKGSSLQAKMISQKTSKKRKQKKQQITVQCFPLYSILLALNQSVIDYLSLDVEGDEKGVLGSIPWQKIKIDMLSIEYDKWQGGTRQVCKYMSIKGYDCIVTLSGNFVSDVILKKKTPRERTRTVVSNK